MGLLAFCFGLGAASARPAAPFARCLSGPLAEEFGEGMACFETYQYASAIPWFEKAINERPQADADRYVSLVGMVTGSFYLPYLHVGLSYRYLGDCPKALKYFRKSCDQKEVRKKKRLLNLLNDESNACWKELGLDLGEECRRE